MEGLTYSYLKMVAILSVIWLLSSIIIIGSTYLNIKPKKQIPKGAIVLDGVRKAMNNLGPNYHYRMLYDGTLQVNKGNGKWLRLKYERRY